MQARSLLAPATRDSIEIALIADILSIPQDGMPAALDIARGTQGEDTCRAGGVGEITWFGKTVADHD